MRKIYIVPNLVTTANMAAGFYSVIAATQGRFVDAAWAIVLAAVFDSLDGRIARLARATSEFGVQYDSLSDLISFGLAPGFLLYQWAYQPYGRVGMVAAFFFTVCGALRLARFNVTSDRLPGDCFQGLPIPGGAGVVATFVIFHAALGIEASVYGVVLALGLGLGFLMVSSFRFPSFKELNWRSKTSFPYWLGFLTALTLIVIQPEIMLFVVLSSYVVGSLVWNFIRWQKGESPVVRALSSVAGESKGSP